MSKLIKGQNDLATTHPELIEQWHPTKNGDLTPSDVTPGSKKMVWWICEKGHEWENQMKNRNGETGCPYCSGKRPIAGENDLATTHPMLAKQWHPTKNGDLTPSDVTPGSGKKVCWVCENGHEWEANISDRARADGKGSGCPYCSGKRPIAGENDLATTHPMLAKQWHPTKNGDLTPSDVTPGSGKKVWWVCENGHEWAAKVLDRARIDGKETGCPYCSGQRILVGFNDLGTTHPQLIKEWHPKYNGNLKPINVSLGSTKKVWWRCTKCGHEWQAAVYSRTSGRGCPKCSLKKQGRTYVDGIIKKDGSLKENNPALASEWHPTKNGNKTPEMFTVSSQTKVWWKCSLCGYEWQAKIGSRSLGNGCPECSKELRTSFPEQAILFNILKYFPDAIGGNRKILDGMEMDIYIPSIKTAIEYDGYRWHLGNNALTHETEKNQKCKEKGIVLIRIREKQLKIHNDCVCIFRNGKSEKDLERCIIELFNAIGIDKPDVNLKRDRPKIYELSIKTRKEHNLLNTNPVLSSEWNYSRNGSLTPDMVSCKSGRKVWWICSNCGYEWESTITHRANGSGCPKCYQRKTSKRLQKRVQNVETGKIYDSITIAARENGITGSTLSTALYNNRRTAGGFHWRFIKD